MYFFTAAVEAIAESIHDLFFADSDKDDESAKQIVKANYDDIVSICSNILNNKMEPIHAVSNMKASLYQVDPTVLQMSLRVLQNVMEERGLPVATRQADMTQFLNGMREILRNTSHEGVRDSLFELNESFKRVCSTQPSLQGVENLIDTFNKEGYKVLVVKSNGGRHANNVNSDDDDDIPCYICDVVLQRNLQHPCKYCQNIFCDECCTCQSEDRSYRPGRAAICVCERCRKKNNSLLHGRSIEDRQTVSKAARNEPHQHSSGLFNHGEVVRYRGGNDDEEEDSVQLNVVVPRDVADDPEGWSISIQRKKNENSPSQVNRPNRKGRYKRMPSYDEKEKLYNKDIWEGERHYTNKGTEESEESQDSEEDNDAPLCATRRRGSFKEKKKTHSASAADKKAWEEEEAIQRAIELSMKEASKAQGERLYTNKGTEESEESQDSEEDNNAPLCDTRRRGSFKEKKKTCSASAADKKAWEEEEAIQRAIELSMKETSKAQTCSASAADKKAWEEEEAIQRAIELSMKEASKANACCASKKDKLAVMEEEELQKAIELSKKQMPKSPKVCSFQSGEPTMRDLFRQQPLILLERVNLERANDGPHDGEQHAEESRLPEDIREIRLKYFETKN